MSLKNNLYLHNNVLQTAHNLGLNLRFVFEFSELQVQDLIDKNIVTDRDISVTENDNMTNFGNQGQSHGTVASVPFLYGT